jgi:hypothetical protein
MAAPRFCLRSRNNVILSQVVCQGFVSDFLLLDDSGTCAIIPSIAPRRSETPTSTLQASPVQRARARFLPRLRIDPDRSPEPPVMLGVVRDPLYLTSSCATTKNRRARPVLAESDETFAQVATRGRAPIARRHRIGNAISSIEFFVEIRFVSWKECPFRQTF